MSILLNFSKRPLRRKCTFHSYCLSSYAISPIILIPVWLDNKSNFQLCFSLHKIFITFTLTYWETSYWEVYKIVRSMSLSSQRIYFCLAGEGRKSRKLSTILSTNMQTIDPERFHWADSKTKPTKLHKQSDLQHYQVTKPTSLLLLSVPDDTSGF